MSKIELAKPTLIMFYGYPGAGKTWLARQLAEELNASHIDGDKIRSELFEDPQYSKREDLIVTSIMNYLAEELLKAGVSVLYDTNTERFIRRKELREVAHKHKATPVLAWLQIDIESAFYRVSNRDRRKTDDKYARSLDRNSFEAILGKMQNPAHNEEYVVVSGKHTFNAQSSAIIKKLYEVGCIEASTANSKVVKPGLVNLVPKTLGGRVDISRRNILIN